MDGINYTYGAHIEQVQLCAQNTGKKSYFNADVHKLYISSTICYNWFLFYMSTEPPVVVPGSISRRGRITLVPANNVKVIARYYISRRNGTFQINKFSLVVGMHPYWKIGDTVLLMLYQGTGGLFLFIDDMSSRRDQAFQQMVVVVGPQHLKMC